jgi:hypothetical protein
MFVTVGPGTFLPDRNFICPRCSVGTCRASLADLRGVGGTAGGGVVVFAAGKGVGGAGTFALRNGFMSFTWTVHFRVGDSGSDISYDVGLH